jgi:surface carbohydrate biosynthesis protein (TIGR04326 family)
MLLNYFEDPRTYELKEFPMPLPDRVAINGKGAQKFLNEAGFPEEKMVVVEALRYMYLNKDRAVRKSLSISNNKKILLVLTGINKDEARQQLHLLKGAAKSGVLAHFDDVILKPHPYCPIEAFSVGGTLQNQFRIVSIPLPELLPKADIVFAANNTSSSLEAALLGIPIIVNLANGHLNHSVLQGYDGTYHVASVDDLCEALANCTSPKIADDYFCLNENLPNWRRVFNAF